MKRGAVIAGALVLTLSGCDGSDSEGETGQAATTQTRTQAQMLSREQYIERADEICRRFAKEPPSSRDFDKIDDLRTSDLEAYVSEAGELYREICGRARPKD